jgi:murein L,D-transpeptidase YafK
MLFPFRLFAFATVFAFVAASGHAVTPSKNPTVILVDKKTNSLSVAEYVDGAYQMIRRYHATLGKVRGDKEQEGDLKTPEGIYSLTSRLLPPSIKPKFGVMAFYVNYPNPFDKLAGRTGFDIMLHATDEPDRLKLDYDSEGCVVVKNEEIKEIEPYIRVGLTPILIFPEMTQEYLSPGKDTALQSFFQKWVQAWETKNTDQYIEAYHSDFTANGMDKEGWKKYKANLNTRYDTISVGPEKVLYFKHPKYSVISFTQNYRSTLKGGRSGHSSRGTKILYVAEEAGKPRIIAEAFTQLMW